MVPACRAGETRHIFGTVFLPTSPRFIRGPIASRISSMRALSASSPSSASGDSSPRLPRSAARINTTGIPLSMQVSSSPAMRSMGARIGRAHGREQSAVARPGGLRQILGVKIESLGRSTTHEGAGNGAHVGSLRLRTVDQSALGQLLPHGVDIQTQLALLQPLAYRG